MEALLLVAVVKTFAIGRETSHDSFHHGREPPSNPVYVATVAILAQGTSRADAVAQAFFLLAGRFATFCHALSNIIEPLWTQAANGPTRA